MSGVAQAVQDNTSHAALHDFERRRQRALQAHSGPVFAETVEWIDAPAPESMSDKPFVIGTNDNIGTYAILPDGSFACLNFFGFDEVRASFPTMSGLLKYLVTEMFDEQ